MQPVPTMVGGPDEVSGRLLLRRSRQMLWLTLVPLLALVLLLAAWQMHGQWRRVLDTAKSETLTQRFAFEGIARDAVHHVSDLQRWMQQEFLGVDGRPNPAITEALQPRRSRDGTRDGHTLDALPELVRSGMGQLMWPGHEAPPAAVLHRAQALSSVIEIAHQRNPHFVWSYFFGWPDRHLMLYPWVPSTAMVEDQGAPSLGHAADAWYGYELVKRSLPPANPGRDHYWTAPYIDAGGKGLLVTRAAPVVVADEVRGVVGTDLRLDTLEALLARLPGAPWQAWVVDHAGNVLADRQDPVASTSAAPTSPRSAATTPPPVPLMAQRLPADISPALLARSAGLQGQAIVAGALHLIAVDLVEAPWTLVLAAPRSDLIRATLPGVLPYSLIMLGLLGVWLAGAILLRVRVVTPLVSIFSYLQGLSADANTPEPSLGQRWQPWVGMVKRTFTSMRSATQAEQRAEALKSAIVDHAQSAVVVADAHDSIVEFNPAAQALFGYSRQQALGQSVQALLVPPRLRDLYAAGTRRMLDGDPDGLLGRPLERIAQRADGSEFPVEAVLWITRVEDAAYTTASMRDLSAVRATALVIERQRDALRQSEKLTAMGSLLAGVAHELNNPLAIVMGRASLLEDKTEGTPLHADAQRIRAAAERCGRIVRTFLNMARSRPAQRGAVQLNDLVQAAADMLGYTLRSHGIQVDLRLAPELPEVQADGDQIGQVVLNLIVNAQQALSIHDGLRRITVRSGLDDEAGSGPAVWVSVADSGQGVPAALRDQIFEPFFTTKPEGMGTGLGLSVSRSIVREHGGDLTLLQTPPGEGALFHMSLPLRAAPIDSAPAPDASLPAALASGRVLVVDDEPGITDLMRSFLEAAGYEVATADTGAVALELLEAARFDAIASDLRMPDIDGAALWRAVRERHPALARRMLFVTGDTLSEGARQFLAETGCLHLAKPFTRADLLERIARTLDTEDPAADARPPRPRIPPEAPHPADPS